MRIFYKKGGEASRAVTAAFHSAVWDTSLCEFCIILISIVVLIVVSGSSLVKCMFSGQGLTCAAAFWS
jgi:hypothetical protein